MINEHTKCSNRCPETRETMIDQGAPKGTSTKLRVDSLSTGSTPLAVHGETQEVEPGGVGKQRREVGNSHAFSSPHLVSKRATGLEWVQVQ